ncbi:MAG TPA: glycosyltransferase family 4 protein [Actinomycetota bacterium]|nr:glycosyltransferase family 4 protein [Actinomycetota bacterium]
MKAPPAHDPLRPPAAEPEGAVLILNWRDTTHPEGGGSEVYVERVAAGLAAQGRPVTLFCAAHRGAPASEQVGGIRVVRRGGRLTVYLHAWWAHLTGRLGRHDVVVDVQNGLPFFSALWCRRPLVVLVHHVHREQWRVVMPPPQARLGWWVESRLAPRLHRRARYVAVSEATRRELAGLGVPPGAITVVHNGMAPPDPAAAAGRTPYPSVCVLGRLVPHKRVELALEAAARIRPHLPELKVLVVGQGYWEPRLREAVDRLGLQDAVELLGWVDEATKQRVLASSWALAMPSVKEGWGLAVLEAAANGTPTVAFRAAGGLRESVLHGTTGLLADDLEEFTRHLAWVLLNRHLRERLGEAARAHAARFTWPQSVAAFAAVLDAAVVPEDAQIPAGEEPAAGRATA